jgi:hypothetical protein
MWPHHIHEFMPEELGELLSSYFSQVEMWGMFIPVYDRHPVRKLVHRLAPFFKPILPLSIRTRFLPALQNLIKSDLVLDDIHFSRDEIMKASTMLAVCKS